MCLGFLKSAGNNCASKCHTAQWLRFRNTAAAAAAAAAVRGDTVSYYAVSFGLINLAGNTVCLG
jgi:hypothetical protein